MQAGGSRVMLQRSSVGVVDREATLCQVQKWSAGDAACAVTMYSRPSRLRPFGPQPPPLYAARKLPVATSLRSRVVQVRLEAAAHVRATTGACSACGMLCIS